MPPLPHRHVKLSARIIKLGVDAIVALPRANSEIIELASTILSECATVAYWASRRNGGGLHDLIGLKLVELSLEYAGDPFFLVYEHS